jgi:hypothetical protein
MAIFNSYVKLPEGKLRLWQERQGASLVTPGWLSAVSESWDNLPISMRRKAFKDTAKGSEDRSDSIVVGFIVNS